MKKTVIILSILFALPIIAFAQAENESEIREINLNDSISIRIKQISENEYTDQEEKSEHLRHNNPYKVVTDIAEAQKLLGEKFIVVRIEDEYGMYYDFTITFNDGVKKRFNDEEYADFYAYYPELNVIILEGYGRFDLNDSKNEQVKNPNDYLFLSSDRQLRVTCNPYNFYPGFLWEKWNNTTKEYEFVSDIDDIVFFNFCCWFWIGNNKMLFSVGEGDFRYYEMELIEK